MEPLANGILSGNRRALSKAITLVESTRSDHRQQADDLLARLMPHTGNSFRIGITGSPGVGKSTFIEAIGETIIARGQKLAVLAIDPSSARSGGSILGDKTRMESLTQNERAYIRPTPAGKTLGGVARRSFETMLLCEATGFDVVMVETVGVGQSETRVADMTDMFLLLLSPGGGDELQGIKRGIIELADLLIVNKADGTQEALAKKTASDYRNALKLLRPRHATWSPPVATCSALEGTGIADLWNSISKYRQFVENNDVHDPQRRKQMRTWMWSQISEGLIEALYKEKTMADLISKTEENVYEGRLPASTAANRLLQTFLGIEK
ncbi:MAG: methylmalonyl Co-A mutase-associated GTPase MeaB [bacterium]|nr:methylmalonyl Co-A mutase-associated GTPase MeaB [bacterium]